MDNGPKIEVLFDKKTNAISITLMAFTVGVQLQNNFNRKVYALSEADIGVIVSDIAEQVRLALTSKLKSAQTLTPITLNIQIFDKPLMPNIGVLGHLGGDTKNYFLNNLIMALGLQGKSYTPDESGFIRFTEDVGNKFKEKNVHGYSQWPWANNNNFNFGTVDADMVPPGIIVLPADDQRVEEEKATIYGKGNSNRTRKDVDSDGKVTLS